jgi:dihydrofolate reductase
MAGIAEMDALLLGRKTYDIFAGYWPDQEARGFDVDLAVPFNRMPKYVASRSNTNLPWNNSILVGGNLESEIAEIKTKHKHIQVIGSLNFVQTLISERLFDVINLWVHPILLGEGKRVFEPGVVPANLNLLGPAITSEQGVICLKYGLGSGSPATGDMSQPDRGLGTE